MRIPWQVFWQYVKILLEDVPMIIVAIALWRVEQDRWRQIVIFVCFVVSVVSLVYTAIWMRFPFKINRDVMEKAIRLYAAESAQLRVQQQQEQQQQ